MADISNGSVNQNYTAQTLSALNTPVTPIDIIPQRLKDQTTIEQLVFPLEKPKYFINLAIGDYSFLTRTPSFSTYVRLPMPDKVRDMNSTSFTQTPLSAFVGTSAEGIRDIAKSVTENINNEAGLATAVKNIGSQALSSTSKNIQAFGVEAVQGGAGVATTALNTIGINAGNIYEQIVGLAGYAPNQFLTIMLKGPQFKKYSFSWVLSPNNPTEARNIKNIIKTLNKARAVDLTDNGLFFKFPKIFQLAFKPDDEYLYQFKPSVMEHFIVDYFSGKPPTFLKSDVSTNGKNPPESVTITASFMDLEFWLAKDIK